MNFLSLKPEIFGLDISDYSLKIIKLKRKGNFLSLASFGETEIKPGIIDDGEIKDSAALAEIIKEGLNNVKGERLKTKNLIASLPEKKAFLEVIQMPKMEEEELKTAVPFEAENYIPLPIREVYLDFQIIPSLYGYSDEHLDILIAAISKKIVDSYVSSFKKAGLFPQALEIESQSIGRALIKNGVSAFPLLLIDFGKNRTSFIIFSGFSLRFTTTIPIASQHLTEAISRALKQDLIKAEKLKIKYGLQISEKNKVTKIIFEAMAPVLTDLVGQIKRYISYYQTHASHEHLPPNGRKIEKILICGGGANLKGLDDFLSTELKIPVDLGNPWINILPAPLKEVPQLSFKDSLRYTVALGLALRGLINE